VRSHLLEGLVRHRRARPFRYELAHRVFYLAVDLDELDEVPRRVRLISRNRRNVLSIRDADHWLPPAGDLRSSVHAHLREQGIDPTGWRITLVTNARVVGYVFNPVSFFLCRDPAGSLALVVTEVNNTHGERHLYTLRPERDDGAFVSSMKKEFYVSPFIATDGSYAVRVRDEPDRLRITINQMRDGALQLHASMDLARRRLSSWAVVGMLMRYPLVTHRTIGMIHVHAFRLWRMGARHYPHRRAAA
jgi:uncharacterized protein